MNIGNWPMTRVSVGDANASAAATPVAASHAPR
jgi:hypothetical protein